MNFHELVRDALEPFREAHPDSIVELEHRGDGEGRWDEAALRRDLDAVFRRAFEIAGGGPCRLWFRTDARADDEVVLKMEISGLEITRDVDLRARANADDLGPKIALRRPRNER